MSRSAFVSWSVARLLLRLISFGVPARLRTDWIGEWEGELWEVRNAPKISQSSARLSCVNFVWGSLLDAKCLRNEIDEEQFRSAQPLAVCLLTLFLTALVTAAIAFSLPNVRAQFRQRDWRTPPNVSLVFLAGAPNETTATVTPEQFHLWQQSAPYLRPIVYYQVERRSFLVNGRSVTLRVAHATRNLWTLTSDSPMRAHAGGRQVFLTKKAWRDVFNSDPAVFHHDGLTNGHVFTVEGVAELEDSGLPGSYQAWLFDDEPMRPEHTGYVLGKFSVYAPTDWYFGYGHISIRETRETETYALTFPVAERKIDPWYTLALGLLLSLLAVPATTPLGFGEHLQSAKSARFHVALRRWLFMFLKCLLLSCLAASCALIIADFFSASAWRQAVEARVFITLFVSLLGFRWSIRDQRKRCPICLKQLTSPAYVGEPSKTFLSWNGTELVCDSGHGLMHVPAHATSWFSNQRWLALDSSWQFLFAAEATAARESSRCS